MAFGKDFLSKDIDFDAGTVTFALGNGSKLVCHLDHLSEKMRKMNALHGISQKVGDKSANKSKSNDYLGALSGMQAAWDAMLDDSWNIRGESAGEGDFAAAYAEALGVSVEEANRVIDAADEAQKQQLREVGAIAAIMKRIAADRKAERARKNAQALTPEQAKAAIEAILKNVKE